MASRTSTVVNRGKGALIYHNDSTSAQLVTINAAAQDGVSNPKISVILDSTATNLLNQEVLHASTGGISGMGIDLAVLTTGTADNIVTVGQNAGSYMADRNASNFASHSQPHAYQFVDPWFWHKPSEFGNASDAAGHYIGRSNSDGYVGVWNNAVGDVKAGTYTKKSLYEASNSGYSVHKSQSYYQRGFAFCQYTLSFMSLQNSGYMSAGVARPADNAVSDVNGTSGSPAYQVLMNGTGQDPYNYPSHTTRQIKHSPEMMAEGGVFILNYQNPSSNSESRVHLCVTGRGQHGGALPTDHSATNSSALASNPSLSSLVSTAADCTGWFATERGSFQWMKYNKANDKYYYCFKHSTAANAGIYELPWKSHTSNANTNIGTDGSGPYNVQPHSFSSFVKVGDYPISNTQSTSIPAKVGANLWLMYDLTSGFAYFSENLGTWTPATTYLDGAYIIKNQDVNGADYLLKSDGTVVQVSTGLAQMSQAGLLEKGTAIGNYTRNGLVLNPGDALYADNDRASLTSVSFTVTEVAI